MKRIILLGASGSIGEQTLDIISANPEDFRLVAFSVGYRTEKIDKILKKNKDVRGFCVEDIQDGSSFKKRFPNMVITSGDDGLNSLIAHIDCDLVVNALVGFVGFPPTVFALNHGIDVALANKESLVVGGELINDILSKTSVHLYPIDSEHVALSKCLEGHSPSEVSRLVITASGGAFRNLTRDELLDVKPADALKHPSWAMGKKITIDSATMMNKGFEVIEAHYLFNIPADRIAILMHDESKVHSLVNFLDGSYLADIGPADMRIPIAYALYGQKRTKQDTKQLSIEEFGDFHFHKFQPSRFPCVGFALKALRTKGTLPAVLNASNEVAVNAFLDEEISFIDIESIIEKSMENHRVIEHPNLEQIVAADKSAREFARKLIKEISK